MTMMSMGLYFLMKCPTRITNKSTSVLDFFYINFNTDIFYVYGIINYEITDHLPIFFNIKLEKHMKRNNGKIIYKKTLNKNNIKKLIN